MKHHAESKVFAELRKIRDEIHQEASAVGWRNYYADLHKRAGFFFGSFPRRRTRRSRSAGREPKAVKEVHAWRRELRKQARKSKQGSAVVRERPRKYKIR